MRNHKAMAVVAVLTFLPTGAAFAAVQTLVCRFPERVGSVILPEIILRTNTATYITTVEDKHVLATVGKAVEAKVEVIRKDRKVLRKIYSWRVDETAQTSSNSDYVDLTMKVETDGRAYIRTETTTYVNTRAERGTCTPT